MKRRGNRAAKGGMEMEIYMGNQKRGRKIKRKLLSIGALLLALPVYGISNGLFQLAVCRDDRDSLLQREGLKKLWNNINGRIAKREKKKREERCGASRKEGWVLLILERNWRLGKHGLRNRKRSASP